VEKNTVLPEAIRLESDFTGNAWARIADHANVRLLEKAIAAAGWTFFYMAGTIRASAFGFDRQKMVHAALVRLFRTLKGQGCNCLEIDDVESHSFAGMPYLSVLAHGRRIEE